MLSYKRLGSTLCILPIIAFPLFPHFCFPFLPHFFLIRFFCLLCFSLSYFFPFTLCFYFLLSLLLSFHCLFPFFLLCCLRVKLILNRKKPGCVQAMLRLGYTQASQIISVLKSLHRDFTQFYVFSCILFVAAISFQSSYQHCVISTSCEISFCDCPFGCPFYFVRSTWFRL